MVVKINFFAPRRLPALRTIYLFVAFILLPYIFKQIKFAQQKQVSSMTMTKFQKKTKMSILGNAQKLYNLKNVSPAT